MWVGMEFTYFSWFLDFPSDSTEIFRNIRFLVRDPDPRQGFGSGSVFSLRDSIIYHASLPTVSRNARHGFSLKKKPWFRSTTGIWFEIRIHDRFLVRDPDPWQVFGFGSGSTTGFCFGIRIHDRFLARDPDPRQVFGSGSGSTTGFWLGIRIHNRFLARDPDPRQVFDSGSGDTTCILFYSTLILFSLFYSTSILVSISILFYIYSILHLFYSTSIFVSISILFYIYFCIYIYSILFYSIIDCL